MRWYERDIAREQRTAELEDQATRLIRSARRKRPAARTSRPPEPPLPDKGWVKLQDLKRALQVKASRS
jgi:hypothetical protein